VILVLDFTKASVLLALLRDSDIRSKSLAT